MLVFALSVPIENGKISFERNIGIEHQRQYACDPRYHVPEQEANDFQDGDGLVRLDWLGWTDEQFDGMHCTLILEGGCSISLMPAVYLLHPLLRIVQISGQRRAGHKCLRQCQPPTR